MCLESLFGNQMKRFNGWSKLRNLEYAAPTGARHHFRLATLLTLVFLVWAGQSLAQGTGQVRAVARQVLPSVVTISVYDAQGRQLGSGSGFLLSSKGVIATCFHVIQQADSAKVHLQSGDAYRVEGCLELDIEKDFAIIKINAVELPTVKLGNSDRLEIAENVIAVGAPLGLEGTVTTGIVSHVRPMEGYRVIQHTAHISPGSSGGPLLNESGQVVGVNSFLLQGGQAIYFALPINYVRAAWENARGRPIPLRQVREAVQRRQEEVVDAMIKETIARLFTVYKDPDGLFSMLIRRDWQVQRNDKEYREDRTFGPHREVTLMNHSPNAEKATIAGWLSEGVRLILRLPPEGKVWKMEWAERWQSTQFNNILGGYSRHRATAVEAVKSGNAPVKYLIAEGESPQISRKEAMVVYLGIHPKCLMFLEITMPADKGDELKLVNTVLTSTFDAGWMR